MRELRSLPRALSPKRGHAFAERGRVPLCDDARTGRRARGRALHERVPRQRPMGGVSNETLLAMRFNMETGHLFQDVPNTPKMLTRGLLGGDGYKPQGARDISIVRNAGVRKTPRRRRRPAATPRKAAGARVGKRTKGARHEVRAVSGMLRFDDGASVHGIFQLRRTKGRNRVRGNSRLELLRRIGGASAEQRPRRRAARPLSRPVREGFRRQG